jgi:tetratricopeptide (TPR) repeat protein
LASATGKSSAGVKPRQAGNRADEGALSEAELAVWNSPEFRKEFQRSYMSETQIEPQVSVEERKQMQAILDLISANKLDQAVQKLKGIRKENTNPLFDYTLANIYFQKGELDRAASLYEQAVEKKQNFRRAWSNLGKIYVRTKQFKKATDALTQVIETGGGSGTTYGLLGYAYASRSMYIPAESAYRKATVLDPETREWKMGLAQSFFRQQRYGEAVAFLGQMLQQQPQNADYWLLQANAYIGLDKPLKAAENYELVDQMGKATYESLNMLGDIYVNEELYLVAVRSYIRAMKLKPERDAGRALQAAQVLAARGAYDATEQLIDQIQAVKGGQLSQQQQKDMLKLRARIALARGAGDKQAKVLERIIEIDPMDGEALMLLGKHYASKDEIEKAKMRYEQAANIKGYEADAKVRLAQLLVQQEKYQEALRLLMRAQKLNYREHVQDYLEQVERVAKQS